MKRYPITPRNSTVLGHDARSDRWRDWWAIARWDEAVNAGGPDAWGAWCGCLHVPCGGPDADGAWYRVRSRREGKARAVRVDGVWYWEYAEKRERRAGA
jgi:hypothetical protein